MVLLVPMGNFPLETSRPDATGLSRMLPSLWRQLVGDRYVRLALVLLVGSIAPYLLPISTYSKIIYGSYFIDVPLAILAIGVIRMRVLATIDQHERRFWTLLGLAITFWVGQIVVNNLASDFFPGASDSPLVSGLLYFCFYALMAVALESRPHVRPERFVWRLRLLDRMGTLVFFLGLLVYFSIIPDFVVSQMDWTSFLALFVVLDAYLVLRLVSFYRTTADSVWRSVFGWLLLAMFFLFSTDFAELVMWADLIPFLDTGTWVDIFWLVFFPAVVIASRIGDYLPRGNESDLLARENLTTGPLVLLAVATPLLHLFLYRTIWADQELRSIRDLLVLVIASALALFAVAFQEMLKTENQRLAKEEFRAKEKLEHRAYHDELTGLPNRRLFSDHLQLAMAFTERYGGRCAVFFFDLDRFKVVNDSLGHKEGDRILKATANRLDGAMRETDTVARFGGDEFAVLVQGVNEVYDAARIAQKLLSVFEEPFEVKGRHHVVTTSIGVAIYPDDGDDEATLLKHADMAMYQAKLKGRNTFQLFTLAMNRLAEERLDVEQGLREALAKGQYEVYFQPIVDLDSRRIKGCEALLRWNHPTEGLIGPGNFIAVAEQTGLIVPIGAWVLDTVLQWARKAEHLMPEDFTVAVNLSLREFQLPGFAARVKKRLDHYGLDPCRLQLEITESMIVESESTSLELSKLRQIGVRVAIDDLGTGFSGLSRLRDLPIDEVKIDRSFIRDIHEDPVGRAIVEAILGMARALDLHVVAEGVETEAQLAVVEELHCQVVQGFFLYRPMPKEAMMTLLQNGC